MPTTFDKHKEYWTNKSGIPSALIEWLPDPTGLQILDLGCAGGRIAASLNHNATVYGLDYSAELLKQAKERNPTIQFICGDFQSPNAWSQIPPLNLIVSNCAIRKDYCPRLADVARLCFEKLTSGGILVLRVSDLSDLSEVLPKSIRESLFFSDVDLLECFKMFKLDIKKEAFRQPFSSVAYMEKFLERTQIPCVEIKNLNPTRRYNIIRAEKLG